jgi:hypothetical protein
MTIKSSAVIRDQNEQKDVKIALQIFVYVRKKPKFIS